MVELVRTPCWQPQAPNAAERLLTREWLVTNGIGGYASGTISGANTRSFHGLLVAALAGGRTMMLNHLDERLCLADGQVIELSGREYTHGLHLHGVPYLTEFRLENGLPVWRFEAAGVVLEKRILMPHRQNTVHISYRLLKGEGAVRLELRPSLHFRPHEVRDIPPALGAYLLTARADHYEVSAEGIPLSTLRLRLFAEGASLVLTGGSQYEFVHRVEAERGYAQTAALWSPGYFNGALPLGPSVTLVATTENWSTVLDLPPEQAAAAEQDRRRRLLAVAHPAAQHGIAAELVLAADQFLIKPVGRSSAAVQARGVSELRSVIAGYHWFTDWGRDTMISLEGLTLTTGRHGDASAILYTFAEYIRNGLIPNLFPEGDSHGLYHTADATLWFFQALQRYQEITGDNSIVKVLLPKLQDIIDHHLRGTLFGIGIDPADGLLRQGAPGYPLTWMDAKVGDWVVTPRRGKAVEINALWYNALMLLQRWLVDSQDATPAVVIARLAEQAARARASFNQRFWYANGGYLYDVIDGEWGDDAACRPNQLFAISLAEPILDEERWPQVLQAVRERLLTPFGLRSLEPGHPDYKAHYFGDLRARDAAYHQGTVWAWLIGPFIDAWLRVYPEDKTGARRLLENFDAHLSEACIGSISEIFDAETPFTPRGCVAQAWSVAEILRCWVKLAGAER